MKESFEPHIKLCTQLPEDCKQELLAINDYYGLPINKRYYKTSLTHAFRSYSDNPKHGYTLPPYNESNTYNYRRTESWNLIPYTTEWITENICDEEDIGLMSLQKLKAGGYTDWHSHKPYDMKIVHFSLTHNPQDLSEVKKDEKVYSMNYNFPHGYVFNSYYDHRSTNFSDEDRIHLVVECSPTNEKLQNLYPR